MNSTPDESIYTGDAPIEDVTTATAALEELDEIKCYPPPVTREKALPPIKGRPRRRATLPPNAPPYVPTLFPSTYAIPPHHPTLPVQESVHQQHKRMIIELAGTTTSFQFEGVYVGNSDTIVNMEKNIQQLQASISQLNIQMLQLQSSQTLTNSLLTDLLHILHKSPK